MDYNSKRWQKKRLHILKRDGWIDQVRLKEGVKIGATLVHHILPAQDYPEYEWSDWNLVSISDATHRRLHDKFTKKLTKEGQELAWMTAYEQGIQLRSRIMVIGKPGTGKSTWAKKHLFGGLCYELDSIACAFRLTVPHKEPEHSGARRMAAALRSGWLAAAEEYTNRIIIVRTAPDIQELEETRPDKLVICKKIHTIRPYQFDAEEYDKRLAEAEKWAKENGVEVEILGDQPSPPGTLAL